MNRFWIASAGIVLLSGCVLRSPDPEKIGKAQAFLDVYTRQYLKLSAEAAEAEWRLNTRIVEGDKSNAQRVEVAQGALADFTGSVRVIEKARTHLEEARHLHPLQEAQLRAILYQAADNPQTVPDLVRTRIKAEAQQTETLFGFPFEIDGKPVTANDIDRVLTESNNEAERLQAWEASKEVGTHLKPGLAELVELRNATVQALDYDNYFQYQVSEYDMTVAEMMGLMGRLLRELRPLYRELHTMARYELAEKFGAEEVPDLIPAHWLPNRWGQSWASMVTVEGFDLDSALAAKQPEWLIRQAERFYISLGFDPLPASFWDKSSLYPLPAGADFKKNNHASAWHMDLQDDVRCLMSVEPNSRWYETTHHELGHIYYYMAYTDPDVPPLLREGANRAFHEAIGSLLGMASMQKSFVQGLGLIPEEAESDEIQALLKEALDFIVFLPFSAGTMTHFEHDLYATDLPIEQYNQRWWEYVAKFQGIAPPRPRGEEFCDAASKTHINNDAAQYYDYALSFIILHQFHAHIAKAFLQQDPRNTNYFGNREIGDFLHGVLKLGATRDWRKVMKESVGGPISAQAILEYFAPLMNHLKQVNAGRTHSLPEF